MGSQDLSVMRYGFYSALAVRMGHSSDWYLTPSGEEVEVTLVSDDPDGKDYTWKDKESRGFVTQFARVGARPQRAKAKIA